LFSIG